MARNFPDFLTGYCDYAADAYCPPQFHQWVGLSVIAGALERKVWVAPAHIKQYPNIYCLLVSHPSTGKSTALERGVDLLEELKTNHNADFKLIPTQITEPGLVDMMGTLASIEIGTTIVRHSSGYFYASEASQCALQNLHGDFNATITLFYDCPRIFRKKIKMENHVNEIPNICFNVLAGSTFDYLKNIINEDSVMGGLASRFIYVIHRDRIVREPKWDAERKVDEQKRKLLLADLARINQLKGKFKPTPEFIQLWEDYQPEFDKFLIGLKSPRMESIMARKSTNLLKVCMILSASERDDLVLNESHWEKAKGFIDDITKDNALILSSAIIAQTDTQASMNQLILQTVRSHGGATSMISLRSAIFRQGNDVAKFEPTLKFLIDSRKVQLTSVKGSPGIELLVDPDGCL